MKDVLNCKYLFVKYYVLVDVISNLSAKNQ